MRTASTPLLLSERAKFHQRLLSTILTFTKEGIPSNADKGQLSSIKYARSIIEQLGGDLSAKHSQTAQNKGHIFEAEVAGFIRATFCHMEHLRPGKWQVEQVRSRSKNFIGCFAQYAHILELQKVLRENSHLSACLGDSYTIAPDVVVVRNLEPDSKLNETELLVDDREALAADIRDGEGKPPLLHASISCKWTLRSDRAQNSRSEALNLIRNRKGRQPHIIVVTGEPSPSRLSSIALGTGDIDCVYHFALYELVKAVEDDGNDEAMNLITMMIQGKRLKDISDLPLDLAV